MMTFTIFPAIDLRQGHVVRLAEGDKDRQTVYGHEPRAVAERWVGQGADWLHVVNLDGALGEPGAVNQTALAAICALGVPVQFGGGLRDRASLQQAFELGVRRVVIGTAAVEQPELVGWALAEYGAESVAVGLDARDGLVRVRGWETATGIPAIELGRQLRLRGVEWCIFTDVARDGLQTGVNVAATTALSAETGLKVIASGGVAGRDDIDRVHAAGLAGVIVGRALYEGHVDLGTVVRGLAKPAPSQRS
jgi:phosphoribosylformimino-5-aminoimidazole carboxamide ribotide isomerase